MWQPEGLLVAFPVIVYSFTAHPYYLGIFNNLHSATFMRMSHVTDVVSGGGAGGRAGRGGAGRVRRGWGAGPGGWAAGPGRAGAPRI